jgi:hypothetical protein
MTKHGLAALVALGLVACSPSFQENGTPRANQRTLIEGRAWSTPYSVGDVRVSGQRIVVLVYENTGVILAVSDDRGETWRQVPVGSVGNISGFSSMSLYLDGARVILMVARQVARPYGDVFLGQPYEVDLATGTTTALGGAEFLSITPAAIGADGTWLGASFAPEDQRGGTTCHALLEKWKPGVQALTRSVAAFQYPCTNFPVPGSNDGRVFQALSEQKGYTACLATYNVPGNVASATCVPWAEWPALSEPFISAAYANERAEVLRPFTHDGQAYVASPLLPVPIALGPGVPSRNRAVSGRPRFPGMVAVSTGPDAARLVRVNREGTVDEVLLPSSPCEGNPYSCFDPENPDIARADYGDALWAEPLGNDEFLVVYLYDSAPGIDVKLRLTASRERATYQRVTPNPGPVLEGPAGYPQATRAGPLAEYCVKKLACAGSSTSQDIYNCVGTLMYSPSPWLDAALVEANAASCTSPVFTLPGYFDCRVRGGVASAVDNGQGQLVLKCEVGSGLTAADCNSCVGDVAVSCPAGVPVGTSCSATGRACTSGRCTATACTSPSTTTCSGDKGTSCSSGTLLAMRCDLLGMGCNALARSPGWMPCVSKTTPDAFSQTNVPARCEGRFLLWDINGLQWADCRALGFSGCAGGRCTP